MKKTVIIIEKSPEVYANVCVTMCMFLCRYIHAYK